MSLPSNLNDETNLHTCVLVSTAETINYEKTLVRKLLLSDVLNSCPSFLRSTVVIVMVFLRIPPYCIVRVLIINDELILRRTTSVDTSHYVYCTKLSLLTSFIALKTLFCFLIEQYFVRRIVQYFCCTCNTVLLKYALIKLCHFL